MATPTVSSAVIEDDDIDAQAERLVLDIRGQRERISKVRPSVENLYAELKGTVMSFLEEIATSNYRANKGMYIEFDDRLAALEGGGTQIDDEDAEKFIALADSMIWLADAVLAAGTNPDWAERLAASKALAIECKGIVGAAVLDEDDGDDA